MWPAAVAAAASGDAFSIDDALHNPQLNDVAVERGGVSVLAPMMDKTEALFGDALKVLRSGASDFSSCCWGGGNGGKESYSARSLVAVAAVCPDTTIFLPPSSNLLNSRVELHPPPPPVSCFYYVLS